MNKNYTLCFPKPRLYMVIVLLPVIFMLLLLIPSYILFLKTDEISSMKAIVKKQVGQNTRYAPLNSNRYAPYKLELYKYHKTDIVALGSSRVWGFSPNSFHIPFISLGSAVSGLQQMNYAVKEVYKIHPPKIILFGLDYWWFHSGSVEPLRESGMKLYNDIVYPPLTDYFVPYHDILKGHITVQEFWRALIYKGKHSGYIANFSENGIDKNGRSLYVNNISNPLKTWNCETLQFADEIEREQSRFLPGDTVSLERWDSFLYTLDYLREQNTEVIFFLPPISPDLYRYMMEQNKFDYIYDLSRRLQNIPDFEFYDYSNVTPLGWGCEFRDGLHGDDVLYLRILKDIVGKTKTSLPYMVNIEEIEATLKR